jgi:hypothetical protein
MRTEAQLNDLFNECLRLLPVAARSKIQNLWRDETAPLEVPVEFRPLIMRVEVIKKQEGDGEPFEVPSCCALTDGIRFWFKTIVVDEAPDEILRTIIVHELGHARRAAEWLAIPVGERPARNRDEEEAAADALCVELDFDLEALRTWLREKRLILRVADS